MEGTEDTVQMLINLSAESKVSDIPHHWVTAPNHGNVSWMGSSHPYNLGMDTQAEFLPIHAYFPTVKWNQRKTTDDRAQPADGI